MNVIPCTTWVRRGVAATIPEKVENDKLYYLST